MEADEPFNSTALADAVLRSSDNVHFYVLGAFLRYVSPIFRDMFSLNQGLAADENEIRDGYPVIPLQEDGETIRCLLSVVYPYINKPRFDNTCLLIKVWKMAEKYSMDTIVRKLQKLLRNHRWMEEQPHRVFAIAVILGWDDGAETAKQTLLLWDSVPYCEEFKDISGADYCGLIEYRFRHGRNPEQPPATELQLPVTTLAHGEANDASVGANDNVPADHIDPDLLGRNVQEIPQPFQSSANADIILRSSDTVDFHVSRSFLGLISPSFDNLFSCAEGGSQNGQGIVRVTDHSEALHQFLLMLYHRIDEPLTENTGLIADICVAARKYDVPAIEARLKKQLATTSSLIKNPLCVYAIGMSLGWVDVAKAAAKNILNAPLGEVVTCIPELQRITGADLHHLVDYRAECVDAACGVINTSQMHREYGPGCIASKLRRFDRKHGLSSGNTVGEKRSNDVEDDLVASPRGSTYVNIFSHLLDEFDSPEHQHQYWSVPSVIAFIKCCRDVANAIEEEIERVDISS